jgi:hypothetical protein
MLYDPKADGSFCEPRRICLGGQVGDRICPIIAIKITFLRPLVPAEEPGAAFLRLALERVVRFAVSSACAGRP